MRELYEGITLATLDRWITERRQEDLHLDCKRLQSGLDESGRKILARALSGFANSDGGIIAWGVDARKDKSTNIDGVSALFPIDNVEAVLSQMLEHTATATAPSVGGVVHRIVHEENGRGIILTYVPASDGGPHMAMFGDRQYYRRYGATFRPMEHYEIADMFGKRQKPDLVVFLKKRKMPGSTEDLHRYEFDAIVENRGRQMARFFRFTVALPYQTVGWPDRTAAPVAQYARYTFPLFPGESFLVELKWPYHMTQELLNKFEGNWPNVTIEIYQEGAPMKRQTISFETLQTF